MIGILGKIIVFLSFITLINCDGGLYSNNKYIYELNEDNFADVINSNYTSIVKFYAPWCKYCREFESVFKKSSKLMSNHIQFAAVNCDESKNKQLCANYRVEGYPTILSFRPPKYNFETKNSLKSNKKNINNIVNEKYQGGRESNQLNEFLKTRVKNYVKRIPNFESIDKFFKFNVNSSNKEIRSNRVLLLTEKTTVPLLFKSIAIDFLDNIEFAYYHINTKNKDEMSQLRQKLEQLGVSGLPDNVEEIPRLIGIKKIEKSDNEESDSDSKKEEDTTNEVEKFVLFNKLEFGKTKKDIKDIIELKIKELIANPTEGNNSEFGLILSKVKKGLFKNVRDYYGKSKSNIDKNNKKPKQKQKDSNKSKDEL
ncbi:hypothetical protein BVG19_g59 [[Candida] boidinii]|nr:hypothetical protein BVG19_g59 [[Candida] boidinii]OWB49627.1 catalytic activity protein [[Candida] boidinii]OWB85744.1 catalytic activity protein [[Candida] boidinii]